MNSALIDPFVLAQDYPETVGPSLRSGHSTTLRFNRPGTLLASGRVDGLIIIFDCETNGIALKLRGHTRQIQTLSWSRCGRYLLSASQDWKCILWDLGAEREDERVLRSVRFEAPVYIAELHPTNSWCFVAALYEEAPVLVDIREQIAVKTKLSSVPRRRLGDGDVDGSEKQAGQDAKITTTVAIFTGGGSHILAGTNKGWLNIIETATCQTIYSTKLCTGVVIFLRLTGSGRDLVVNAQDRIIRTIQLPNLAAEHLDPDEIHIEVEHKFQDVVNRLSWNDVAFSATGEYVTATTYNNHEIYIWERNHGSLVKILEGHKEEHGIIEWHPHRPLIAACGLETGRIHTWVVVSPQRWSALAPDFAEVEENVEYRELQDEFDVHALDEIQRRQLDLENEDVDVLTIEPVKGEIVDEEGASGFKMPVLLELGEDQESDEDLVLVGTGTLRRKSPGLGERVEGLVDVAGSDGVGSEGERSGTPGTSKKKASKTRRR